MKSKIFQTLKYFRQKYFNFLRWTELIIPDILSGYSAIPDIFLNRGKRNNHQGTGLRLVFINEAVATAFRVPGHEVFLVTDAPRCWPVLPVGHDPPTITSKVIHIVLEKKYFISQIFFLLKIFILPESR